MANLQQMHAQATAVLFGMPKPLEVDALYTALTRSINNIIQAASRALLPTTAMFQQDESQLATSFLEFEALCDDIYHRLAVTRAGIAASPGSALLPQVPAQKELAQTDSAELHAQTARAHVESHSAFLSQIQSQYDSAIEALRLLDKLPSSETTGPTSMTN
ncbi:hypothetical protein CAOG_04439 [Capsaspora owczarzaki ATCC 30864]|uniref:Uncharacterized protein n=1 Tax=Capsaspora owczarzaki (strain ATCC 30864) TaxID=595528 RepID=A0A0D2X348_CAPO3|nr:hypothetical protein CAOG_04439 [Capsaspora owczarzaki ATCC 30864]KJE93684.1 hypothetical protein CAOG_004439 [Capsaspora owczarzaki ATCC 30864]|eukprot:XP_004348267.1 hypothetical protein CAOG_04439 [Capsaspora owczarzaki ATCC 30864]